MDDDSNGTTRTISVDGREVSVATLLERWLRAPRPGPAGQDPAALARPGGIVYPALPSAGVLDQLQKDKTLRTTPIQVMGYGNATSYQFPGGGDYAHIAPLPK